MISNLLHEVDHYGIELWLEENKLKYRTGSEGFPEHLKEALVNHKTYVVDRLKENEAACQSGWSVIRFGESYSKRLSFGSEIYIFRETDGSCTLWRGYWKQGEQEPYNDKTLVKEVGFHEAFRRGDDYIQWLNSNKRKAI